MMADEVLDVRGLSCPRPLVETKKKLKKMEPGKTLEVIGDHAPSKIEVPETMGEQGHEIISVDDGADGWHVVIKRKSD